MVWSGYDAVALTAVIMGGGRTLDGLLTNIDVCNHDVPPFEVIGPSLGRLAGAGVIKRTEAGFRLTRLGRKVVRGTRAAAVARVAKVKVNLATVPLGVELTVLDHSEWEETIARYLGRHDR